MPLVIASMLTATNEPRTFAGTTSAIYIGEINEAMPMAMPLTILAAINQVTVGRQSRADGADRKDDAGQYDHFAAPEAASQSTSDRRTNNGAH